MKNIYPVSRSFRDLGCLFCGISVLMLVAGTVAGLCGEPFGKRTTTGLLFAGFVFGFLFLGGLYLIAFARRAKLILDGTRLTHQGVFSSRTLDLADVTSARWNSPNRNLLLKTAAGCLTIQLFHYAQPDRLDLPAARELIRFFRESLPEEIQENWGIYYSQIVLQWRKDLALREGEILLTRRHYDQYALWTFVLLSAAVPVLGYFFREIAPWHSWIGLPLLSGFWVVVRYTIPREGIPVRRTTLGRQRSLWAYLSGLIGPVILIALMRLSPDFFRSHETELTVALCVWALAAIAVGLFFQVGEERRVGEAAEGAAKKLPKVPPELLDE